MTIPTTCIYTACTYTACVYTARSHTTRRPLTRRLKPHGPTPYRLATRPGFALALLALVLLLSLTVPATQAQTSLAPTPQAAAPAPAQSPAANPSGLDLRLPMQRNSLRFGVIGDSGTGDAPQFAVARQMEAYRRVVNFDFVIMLGDNIYGGHSPRDFERKFEMPYRPLLDAGVKFYASLGNHDDPDVERLYKPFNMGGERYYMLKRGDVDFFVLDSTYMDPSQLAWVQKNLAASRARWKICYFHHPLYSDGRFHGSDLDLRGRLEPLFEQYGVNVVLSGHDHVYERVKPQNGIYYFLLGSSGQLRAHDLRRSANTQAGNDTDRTFMLVEIAGDIFNFQVISGSGVTVDSGALPRQQR